MMRDEFFRVVSVSGGKDSTALYLWALDKFGKDGFSAVFADTGNEHPVTVNYVRNLHHMINGPEVAIVKADLTEKVREKGKEPTGNPFLDMMLWKGRAPSARAQFCTEHTKLEPIREWLKANRADRPVILYTGIRAGESAKRAQYKEVDWLEYYDAMTERPLLRWTEGEVFEFLRKHGVPPNPLYRAGFKRVGCFPCIHSRKSELARLPDWAWEKLESWQAAVGQSWFSFGTIPLTGAQAVELAKIGDDEAAIKDWKERNLPAIGEVRQWSKTSRGGTQFDLLAEQFEDVPACMSTWGACE